MTAFGSVVFGAQGYTVRLILLALVMLQLHVCVQAFSRRRAWKYTAFTVLHFAVLLSVFLLLADGIYTPEHLPPRTSFPAAVEFAYRVPWGVYAALEVFSAVAVALCLVSDVRFVRRRPTFDSVKEALDDLPVGVCFWAENGVVALANLKMNAWCQLLTGQPLSDGQALMREIQSRGEINNDRILVCVSEDLVLLFTRNNVAVNGKSYVQLTAADITQQYRVTAVLKEKNAKLRDISVRMKAYSVELTDLVMRRENLNARVMVHDEVGHALLRAKHYFDRPDPADAAALYELLKRTNAFMLSAQETDGRHREDPLEHALVLARGVGVRVALHGEAPENEAVRDIVGRAVRECAVNAVKHAGGDALEVEMTRSPDLFSVSLSSNGAPAVGEITLTGGLKSLSEAAQTLGGTMRVACSPAFTVTLELPK